METTRVWCLLLVLLPLFTSTHGSDCRNIVDNTAAVLDDSFVHLFPKDYTVQLRVQPTDLNNPSLCVWTSLSLLKGDWESLLKQLWQGQQNYRKIDWLIKGLQKLNVTAKEGSLGPGLRPGHTESGCDRRAVALLSSVTLEALKIIRKSNCAPCRNAVPPTVRLPTITPSPRAEGGGTAQVPGLVKQTLAPKPRRDYDWMKLFWRSLKLADSLESRTAGAKVQQTGSKGTRHRLAVAKTPRDTDKGVVSI